MKVEHLITLLQATDFAEAFGSVATSQVSLLFLCASYVKGENVINPDDYNAMATAIGQGMATNMVTLFISRDIVRMSGLTFERFIFTKLVRAITQISALLSISLQVYKKTSLNKLEKHEFSKALVLYLLICLLITLAAFAMAYGHQGSILENILDRFFKKKTVEVYEKVNIIDRIKKISFK